MVKHSHPNTTYRTPDAAKVQTTPRHNPGQKTTQTSTKSTRCSTLPLIKASDKQARHTIHGDPWQTKTFT